MLHGESERGGPRVYALGIARAMLRREAQRKISRRAAVRAAGMSLSMGVYLGCGSAAVAPGPVYDWTQDPQIVSRYRADSLADIGPRNTWGTLAAVGTVPSGTDADGNPTWQVRHTGGGYLQPPGTATQINPNTIIMIAKAVSPTAGQAWFMGAATGGTYLIYEDAGAMNTGTGSNFSITPANQNLITFYAHNQASRVSVQNGAYQILGSTAGGSVGSLVGGICIGSRRGSQTGNVDISEVWILEGQPSQQFLAGLTAYVRGRYPSMSLPSTPPAAFSVDATSLNGLFTAPFDIILLTGQSNNSCHAISGTPTAPGALAYILGNDNVVKAMPLLYDDPTNALDQQGATDSLGGGVVGGNATALVAAYTAATGRPCVVIPSAAGGSYMGPALASNTIDWEPSYPNGNKLRNSLYGSALARLKNMIGLGGTFRFVFHYQGEAEAGNSVAGATPSGHAARTATFITSFFADLGQPTRIIVQKIANLAAPAVAGDVAIVQAGQAGLAVAGSILIGPASNGPYETGNLHLQASAQNAVGAAAAALALAQPVGTGWY